MSAGPDTDPPTVPPDGDTPPAPARRRLGEVAAAVSAIAAVLGVVVGFLGLPAVLRSPTSKQPTVVTVTVTATPEEETSAASTPPHDDPSDSGSPTGKPGSTETAEFDLVQGYGFDLDASPLRPAKSVNGKNDDFYWSSTQDFLWASGEQLINAGQTTRQGCLSSTRYSMNVDTYDISVGQTLCVVTDERVALIEVMNLDQEGDPTYITMKVTSWARP
ncbi:hypothetical protein ACIBL6_18275 [Streptomyces sp. NPDC050400]|uniref:hypothetical protein n=1 Tax=Streptomyces sp. NPDC050400 TaxID=3365610 RepID=UPI00378F55F7